MSDRLKKIVDGMQIRPDDLVLEIGCGHGVAATLVCDRLETGRLVAIDKSKKMIDAAVRRNKKHVESGKAEFHVADMLEFDPGARRFHNIFAVRVGLFHRDAAFARSIAEAWLTPGGKLVVVYDEP